MASVCIMLAGAITRWYFEPGRKKLMMRKKSGCRRILSILLSVILVIGNLRIAALADETPSGIPYVKCTWNGTEVETETKYVADYTSVPADGNMTEGWYYLDDNITKNGRVESITGDVFLILGDGCTLDVKGLYVPEGTTLTIYGQNEGTGKIYSHPSGGAGIGGYSGHNNGNIVIHSGTVEAIGSDHCAGIGSNDGKTGGSITIFGGTVTAGGGNDGAAIGGGRNCSGGTIEIYGGTITANGPTDSETCENGAGIGGGDFGDGGNITICGGNVTTYSRDGAGIGGGDDGDGGDITISGGTITSYKVNQGQGARIGGGCDAAPGTITISGGTITTVGGTGAGIGGGKRNASGGTVTISGGIINASGDYGIGAGADGSDVAITLDYTDYTQDSISITASSYGGPVTLNQPFSLVGTDLCFLPGPVVDNSLISGGALTSWNVEGEDIAYVNPADADIPAFTVHSLLLSGQIGVNFFMELPEIAGVDYTESYMDFTVDGRTTTDVYDPGFMSEEGGYYGFTCNVNSIQMADEITAVFHYGDGFTVVQTYSVERYMRDFEAVCDQYNVEVIALVRALADYGHYVQPFLASQNHWSVGVDHAEMEYCHTTSYSDENVEEVRNAVVGHAIVRDPGNSEIERVTFSLYMDTETSIFVYLYVRDGYGGPVSATLDDGTENVAEKVSDGVYRVKIRNISAHRLGEQYNIVVSAGESFTVTVSALSYVQGILASDAYRNNSEAVSAVVAFYYYYRRAVDVWNVI